MKFRQIAIACTTVLGLVLAGCSVQQGSGQDSSQAAPATPAAPQLHAAMRALWQGHIAATRDYAIAVHGGNANSAARAEAAVIGNAKQIAGTVAGFYGPSAGDGTLDLLGGHWGSVKALTLAARTGNRAAEDRAMTDLAANAMKIARLLAAANPVHWTIDGLNQALLMHAGDHRQQVDAMMADTPAAQQQQLWADMQHHMDLIADALSDGIARQFPDQVN